MNQDTERYTFLIMTIVIVLIVMSLSVLGVYTAFDTWDKRGQFGDMFGAMNAIFSGLAFAAIIYTIQLQRKELSLQRLELELTRDELQKTADATERNAKMQVYNNLVQAYTTILDPASGLKNRNIGGQEMNEDDIKRRLVSALTELEKLK